MKRKTFDQLVSAAGLFLAAVLVIAGSLLVWAHNFVGDEVHSQLAAQQIYFPAKDSKDIAGPEFAAVRKYAGEQLTTGAQAKAYADHFIGVHLAEIGGGQTYAQLSSQSLANPDDTKLAGQVQTMFRGETLRGLLLNAYAFDTMGEIAGYAAFASFGGAAVLLVLAGAGFVHMRRTPAEVEV
ncbi:hypothetical protein, partial [Jatrophihabitans sp.]|uniref:hypothetical protein n=1 Tax=Jatrophihabitans sp. TaxID=1932789 RepID=UPI002B79102C|nr:hypothetical protein [Jatrophihabitans sp.]